jgi:hypothetical protein
MLKRTTIERVEITDKMETRTKHLDWCHENGYTVRHIGPYTTEKMFPKMDLSRFKIVAEKELPCPN